MKRYFCLCLLVGLAFGLIVNPQAFGAKTLYDDFSGNFIDSSKWNESEFVREVAGGNLVSKVANNTSTLTARNNTFFQNPSSINSIQCDINPVVVNLDDGTSNRSFARIGGRFYNTQNSGTHEGDIFAAVYIGNRGSGLEAWWGVYESQDENGSTWIEIGSNALAVPGLTLGNFYTVKIDYNGTNGFAFTVAGVGESFTGPARLSASFSSYKGLETGAEGSSGNGYTSALFDNALVNNIAYDDFTNAPLNQDRWQSDEVIREIANNKLRLNKQGFNSTSQTNLRLVSDDIPYLETKVRIESGSKLSPGASGIARIQGYYYNDSRGPGSGQDYNGFEGDVFAQVRLELDYNGDLKAVVWVDRSNSNQTNFTTLFSQNFSTLIDFDTDYTLSIEFRKPMLIFKCNDETLLYKITTPIYTAFGEHRALRSRVYLDPGASGYIKAQFDDVYVDTEQAQATNDAAGEWDFSTSNSYVSGGVNCHSDAPHTGTATITQTGTNVTLVAHDDEADTTFDGIVSGGTYYLTTSIDEDGGTLITNVILALSSKTSGTGKVTYTWTDGIETCNGGFDIAFTKQAEQPVGGASMPWIPLLLGE
jgi:hypothetical protein